MVLLLETVAIFLAIALCAMRFAFISEIRNLKSKIETLCRRVDSSRRSWKPSRKPSGEYGSSVFCPLSSVLCPLSSVLCHLSSVICPSASGSCRRGGCCRELSNDSSDIHGKIPCYLAQRKPAGRPGFCSWPVAGSGDPHWNDISGTSTAPGHSKVLRARNRGAHGMPGSFRPPGDAPT